MLKIQKFGGTSLGSIERIKRVAEFVKESLKESKVVVVASAMAGETDKLINLAKAVTELPDPRELDSLMSTGEQVSSALLAIALNCVGAKAQSLLSSQVKILTDSDFNCAQIIDIDSSNLLALLQEGIVPVIAGFQGVDESGNITTLGRGGSDTTAVAIACGLKEFFPEIVCEIYTDVDGVYSADPRIIENPRKWKSVSYEEMLEFAGSGAKVLHPRSVALAAKYQIPIVVKSSFTFVEGTVITSEQLEAEPVRGVALDENQGLLTFSVKDDLYFFKVFDLLQEIFIDIISLVRKNGELIVSLTTRKVDLEKAKRLIVSLPSNSVQLIDARPDVSKVTIIGLGMLSQHGIANSIFDALHREGISPLVISTSEIKISIIVNRQHGERACRTIHANFNL
ncbi:MAG: aspartate kinase [Deltaproteobacteria bacterium]|nr:aspartate kinase [Deltaproteobacteria bacterium]MCX7952489.1 aspartate kinase [Deltaproteobacteria bacterium]